VLLYGAQTWSLAEKERRRFILSSGKWNEEYCKLYGATDRLTNVQIRKRTKTNEFVALARSLRWEGGEQVARMD